MPVLPDHIDAVDLAAGLRRIQPLIGPAQADKSNAAPSSQVRGLRSWLGFVEFPGHFIIYFSIETFNYR
jgi:hypothetical protein